MAAQMQNPSGQAGASRDLLCGGLSHPSITASDERTQIVTSRSTFGGPAASECPFLHHRHAALGLLGACPDLPHKAAGFLGHVCVARTLSERQREWLVKLLKRNGLPPLAVEGAQ